MDVRIDGRLVKLLREGHLMTQEEFAEACGLHTRTLQRIESTGIASAHSVKTIAQTLDVDLSDLEVDKQDSFKQETFSFTKRAFGIALSWFALASLVYIPTSEGGGVTTIVAISGFISFVIAYWFLRVDNKP